MIGVFIVCDTIRDFLITSEVKFLLFAQQIECADGAFDKLLKIVEMKHQLACDKEDGGCGEQNYIRHIISNPPHVFITGNLLGIIEFAFYYF